MKKIIIIPDSFKGTITSSEVCEIMESEIKQVYPQVQIVSIPVADGGEGTVDCFLSAMGGVKKYVSVQGVFGELTQGFWGLLSDQKTAVIEMACCAGLSLAEGRLNPMNATTYGVGQLIMAAVEENVEHIILGLGGSASNDGGCGLAAACGVKFIDADGAEFIPTGGTLQKIHHIQMDSLPAKLKNVKITAICDIDNPLFGQNGAAYVFAPQKGADETMVRKLDEGLVHLNDTFIKDLGIDISRLPGGGAAGGMGAGVCALLGAELKMGIETVLNMVGFDEMLTDADLVFTGEGRLDGQSLRGKVVIGVARRAAMQKVPVVAVVGDIAKGSEKVYEEGVTAFFSTNTVAMDFSKSKPYAKENLRITMRNLMRFAHKFD